MLGSYPWAPTVSFGDITAGPWPGRGYGLPSALRSSQGLQGFPQSDSPLCHYLAESPPTQAGSRPEKVTLPPVPICTPFPQWHGAQPGEEVAGLRGTRTPVLGVEMPGHGCVPADLGGVAQGRRPRDRETETKPMKQRSPDSCCEQSWDADQRPLGETPTF